MQDRHTIIKELLPAKDESWASTLASIEPRGFAAVFDGHKRSEPAETARHRLHVLLAQCAPRLPPCCLALLATSAMHPIVLVVQ
jgi:hypothetical protein